MTKLALFIPDARGGGAEKMMVHLANEFAQCGHECDLVIAEPVGPYLERIDNGVNMVPLNTRFTRPGVIYKLARYMRRARPAAMLSAMTYPNIAALLSRSLSGVSMRMVISERIALTVQSGRTPGLKEKLKPVLARLVYRRADHIVAISNGVAENLIAGISVDPQRITTIYNPVVTDRELASHDRPDHPWFAAGSPPVIVAAGRLAPQKDFTTLLHAFARLVQQTPANLLILGEGPERGKLTELAGQLGIGDSVAMPGYADNPYAYMQHSSLFVMSSAWEGFGNVLVEAMACGCPVVSTDCPSGPAEILDNGRYGRLVMPGDPEEMATAMLEALQNPTPVDVLQRRASEFTASHSARRYMEVLTGSNSI